MAKRVWVVTFIAAWVTGLSLLATPSISQADTFTVTEIIVTVGNTTFCGKAANVVDANACFGTSRDIWSTGLGATGIGLTDGQSLVVTQTGGAAGFNFDSSDNPGGSTRCTAASNCATTLFINGGQVALGGGGQNILANNNNDVAANDPASLTHNEAADWSQVGGVGPDSQVYFGYADNLHTDNCHDQSAGTGAPNNCLPSVVGGTDPTNRFADASFFIGGAASGAGLGVVMGTDGLHCNPSNTAQPLTCFDAGAIMIFNVSAVPEPSSVILASTVLVGLAGMACRRRRLQQQL